MTKSSAARTVSNSRVVAAPTRILELDGVRAIAILAVMFYHVFAYRQQLLTQEGLANWSGISKVVLGLTYSGFLGVDLFFVLSGFLITGILLDSQGDPHYLRNFYMRRALRILPLYLLSISMMVFYRDSGPFALLSLCFLSNMAISFHVPTFNGVLWSLAVEEHFYLLWPWLTRQALLGTVAWVSAAICIAEPLIRFFSLSHVYDVYFYSWFRFDGLAFGALLACFLRSTRYSKARAKWAVLSLFGAGALMIAVGIPNGILHRTTPVGAALQFTSCDLLFSAFLLFAVTFRGSRMTALLRNRFFRLTADLSYCLYIVHMMVGDACDYVLNRFGIGIKPDPAHFGMIVFRAALIFATAYAIALFSRAFIERPALRLKRFFAPPAGTLMA